MNQTRNLILTASTLAALATSVFGQCDPTTFGSSGPKNAEWFGSSVDVWNNIFGDDYAIVGGPNRSSGGSPDYPRTGGAKIFRRAGGSWIVDSHLNHSQILGYSNYGAGVAISGVDAAVGAPNDGFSDTDCTDGSCWDGRIFMYRRSTSSGAGTWNLTGELKGDFTGYIGGFGRTISLDGDWLATGIPSSAASGREFAGAVDVLHRTPGTQQWDRVFPKVTLGSASAEFDFFGDSVSISSAPTPDPVHGAASYLLVGTPNHDAPPNYDLGRADLFKCFADGTWTTVMSLTPNPATQPGDEYGHSVSIDGPIALVGAPGWDSGSGLDAGAAFLFEQNNVGIWVQTHVFTAPHISAQEGFGFSVAVDGGRLVVGSKETQRAYIYRRNMFNQWVIESQLHNPGAGDDEFADKLAVSGALVVVGAPKDDLLLTTDSGAAFAFNLFDGNGADAHDFAPTIGVGTYTGCTTYATNDGDTTCGQSNDSPDVWFEFITPNTGMLTIDTVGSSFDTVLSFHNALPGTPGNTIACNDNFAQFFTTSKLTVHTLIGQQRFIRISGRNGSTGNYVLNVSSAYCVADFNHSNSVTVQDIFDFLTAYFGGDMSADINSSGVVSVQDIFDFLEAYFSGC